MPERKERQTRLGVWFCPKCGDGDTWLGELISPQGEINSLRDKLAEVKAERDRLREAILRHRADYLKDGVSYNRNLWDVADALRPVSIAEHRKAVGDQLLAEEARGQITSPLDEATRAAITLLAVAGDDSVLREAILGLMDRAGIPEQAVSCWIEQRPRPGEKP